MPQFLSLVNAEIIVIPLNEGKVFDESMHELDLFCSLICMPISNEENRIKSGLYIELAELDEKIAKYD